MKILTPWLRSYLPVLDVDDAQLAEDLTLRGIAVEGIFELNDVSGDSNGALYDMDITTNRVDAMNHYGVAREVAAIYNLHPHPLETRLPEPAPGAAFPVSIEAEDLCGRFTAQVIRGVTVGASAGTVEQYLGELQQKQISNAVDATNFVLLGMGHPTHAFDLDKISGGIVVRRAHAGEQLRLLDGSTRTLVADDLVIADEHKAISLAGIMGGYDTMITAETRNILVESAWFQPAAIRASSRRHLIHTDASHRFERGADFAAAPIANALVTRHILEACGGERVGPLTDVIMAEHQAQTAGRPAIALSVATTQRLLGRTVDPAGITSALIERYLTALGCRLVSLDTGSFEVTLPSWRLDLTREIDLIEEVARVYGYNGFANTLPTPGTVVAHPGARAEQAIRTRLLALGYSEALSSTFTSAAEADFFAPMPANSAAPVLLENPLHEDASHLRPTLLAGMVTMLAQNLTRDVLSVRLFEMGSCFQQSSASPPGVEEIASFSLGLTGTVAATPLHSAQDAPFFELKGAIESVVSLFEIPAPVFTSKHIPQAFEPGRAAAVEVDGRILAHLGQLAQVETIRRKLRQPVWIAELCLEALLKYPLRRHTAHEISRFQAVERDFSFTFAETIEWQAIASAIHALAIPELLRLQAVEIFRDPRKVGTQSFLIRTVFQSTHRTLTDEDLTGWWSGIIAALETLGGTIRS